MSENRIPTRPDGFDYKGMKKADCDCLTAAVLLGIKNEESFRLYHPEYLDSKGKLSDYGVESAKQFFNAPKHREYVAAMKATVEAFCKGKGKGDGKSKDPKAKDPEVAAQTYRDKVYEAIDAVDATNIDAMKTVGDLGKTVKIFKEETEVVEAPRRYLAESCSTCRYRIFVEDELAKGNIVDE